MLINKNSDVAAGRDFMLNQLLQTVKDFAIILTDKDGIILSWNKGAEKIFNYSEVEITGKSISLLYKNNDFNSFIKETAKALESGEETFETVRITRDDSPFISEVTITPLFDEDRNHFGFSFIMKDLTTRNFAGNSHYNFPEKLLKLNKELEEEIELRIRIERALREKEKEQLDLLEHAPLGIIWTSNNDEIKLMNKTLLELWNYEKEDLANKNISFLFKGKDEAEMLINDAKQGREINNYRTIFLNKNGEERIVSINTSAYSIDDQLVHHRWYIHDLTDKIKGEKAIAESERLGRILDNSYNEIYIINCENYRFVQVNKGALQNLGYTNEEIIKLTPPDITPDFDVLKFRRLIEPLLTGEKDILLFESVHKRKNGTIYPVEVRLQLNLSEARPMLVAIILDITERRRAQIELEKMLQDNKIARAKAEQEANKFLLLAHCGEILNSSLHYKTTLTNAARILLPTLADWIAIDLVDERNEIYRVALQHADENLKDAAQKMIEYKPRKNFKNGAANVIETGNSLFFEQISPETIDKNAVDAEHAKLARQLGLNSCIMVPLKVRNNILGCLTLVYAEKNYSREELALAEEIAQRMAVAIENARLFKQIQKLNTQLLRRADELTASNSELERFAYVASHDLQEPLRVITSFLQLLDKKFGDDLPEKAKEYVSYAISGSLRMRHLIQDLLNYSRIDAGRNIRTQVDLNMVVEDVINNLSASIIESRAKLKVPPLPVIHANKLQMMQLFQNIISNSIKYKKDDTAPVINISYRKNKKHIVISVADNGIGISPQYHNKIFEMFQRLHTREEYSGTGIGLAICKKIMDQHNGELGIESAEGAGAKFIMKFPVI